MCYQTWTHVLLASLAWRNLNESIQKHQIFVIDPGPAASAWSLYSGDELAPLCIGIEHNPKADYVLRQL